MAGYQPGRGRGGGERPHRHREAPDGPGSPAGRRRDGSPASGRDGAPATRPRGTGYADAGHPDSSYPDRGYPDRGYPDRGYPAGGRAAGGYPGSGYPRDAGHRDAGTRDRGYRGAGAGDARQRDSRGRDGYQGGSYRDTGLLAGGYQEPGGRGGTGYRDGYRDSYRPGQGRGGTAPDRYAAGPGDPRGWEGGGRDTTGGADGNERLTALTGALLLGLLAAEGLTILAIHQLLTLHFFIGMLLVGPVLLKAGSTGYRFARYYSGAPDYRRKGPPAPLLRLLGPFVLGLSLAVIGSGIMLAVTGPAGQLWMFLHKASFVLWFGAMSIHVLAYIWRLPHLVTGDLVTRAGTRARDVLAGRQVRWLLLAASILLGLLLALLTYHTAGAWAGFSGGG